MQPASGNEQTVCEFVRYCMNCTYTGSIQNVIFITNESTCYKKIEIDTTIEAATYLPQTGTCSIYYNDGGLSFAEGHVTYIRTCQSGNGIDLLYLISNLTTRIKINVNKIWNLHNKLTKSITFTRWKHIHTICNNTYNIVIKHLINN